MPTPRFLRRPAPPAFLRGLVFALAACSAAVAAEPERWLKVEQPEFTVITSLREKEAVAWAAEFSQFVAALQGFIHVDPKRLPRLTMVVFARERDFARFKPRRENGSVEDVAGFFSRRPSWAVAGLAGTSLHDETRATIFHEGTHWFLSAIELPNPVWLEEGLAETFSTFTIEGKNVSWGRVIEPHVLVLRTVGPMPLEKLLFLAHESLHAEGEDNQLRTGVAYAQSWAFVHYLIFGQHDVPKRALVEYVDRLRTMHPDDAFRQAFGGSYAEIDRKLATYVQTGKYYVAKQPLAARPALTAEPATAVEVDDALARLRIVGHRRAEARENVERVVAAAPDDPRSYVLQGELAQEDGDLTAARVAYQKAIDKDSRDFRPFYEVATAEHEAAGESDGSVHLEPEAARAIANRYEHAINLNPRFAPAYQGLAGLVGLVPPGNTEDVRFLEFGVKLYPDDGMIRLGLASLAKRARDDARARTLLQEVLADSRQPTHVTAYARRLEAGWLQNDVFGRVDALAKEKKFAEALAVIDEQLKAGADFALRQRLTSRANDLRAFDLLEQAQTAMAERRVEDARTALKAVLESNASPILKGQVRRQLEQLDKRAVKKTR